MKPLNDTKKKKIDPKRKFANFDWTPESIEKASLAVPTAPVQLANTSLESIISRN